MQTIKSPCIILDDAIYYIELNCNYEASSAPGFLHRRCTVGVTTPGGYECIGSFDKDYRGMWNASIDTIFDPETDSDATGLGDFDQRLDAIVALWSARRSAYFRHSN